MPMIHIYATRGTVGYFAGKPALAQDRALRLALIRFRTAHHLNRIANSVLCTHHEPWSEDGLNIIKGNPQRRYRSLIA
jgi:hypothetical protein